MTAPDTITILSTPTCSRCKIAVKHLEAKGVEFEYVDVTQDEEWAGKMRDRNLKNVPQTVRGETWIEGLDFNAINTLF